MILGEKSPKIKCLAPLSIYSFLSSIALANKTANTIVKISSVDKCINDTGWNLKTVVLEVL